MSTELFHNTYIEEQAKCKEMKERDDERKKERGWKRNKDWREGKR